MSTNNFSFKNILVAIDDDQAEIFDDYIVPEIQEELELRFPKGNRADGYPRNENGKKIFDIPVYLPNGELYKEITVLWRSGYYSGANIDYIIEDSSYRSYEPTSTKTVDAKVVSTCRAVEKILRRHGTELRKVGQFSNGEAVYQRA